MTAYCLLGLLFSRAVVDSEEFPSAPQLETIRHSSKPRSARSRNADSAHQWLNPSQSRRWNSSSTLVSRITTASIQSYISTSHDPFLNLSFEHHLLQSTPPESTVLFLYINRPCVVIGRNQNPWAEVNLRALAAAVPKSEEQPKQHVDLVRRRSGGGTVFHDHGNVNWTVISPASSFTRDKHVEMVVRGLRACGIDRARVNERHDIVLDTASAASTSRTDQGDGATDYKDDTHRTRYTVPKPTSPEADADASHEEQTVKVSGSAYKLTRGRALHHGTCLLASPHLSGSGSGLLSRLLRAPGADYIAAKGVASVRSPVANVGIPPEKFIEAVQHAFATMYLGNGAQSTDLATTTVDGNVSLEIPNVQKGMQEMKAQTWTLGQTPHFTLSIDTTAAPSSSVQLAPDLSLPRGVRFSLAAKQAVITEATFALDSAIGTDKVDAVESLVGRNLAENDWTWDRALTGHLQHSPQARDILGQLTRILDHMLPIGGGGQLLGRDKGTD